MTRREFATLLAGAAGFPAILKAARQPNFVIVLCDDLGYGDLGCYGNSILQTPNLDGFAKQGVKFTDCYAAAPVCSPARAGMLTGRCPDRSGVYDWIPEGSPMHLRREETTFASVLKPAGYATCHAGKWHSNGKFNSAAQPQPNDHGFDYWFSTQNNAAPSHENPVNFVRNGERVGEMQGYSSQLIVEEAIEWLKGVRPSQPYCLFVCFHSPHEPVATAARFTDMYPKATGKGEALYYGNVTQMDHEFGRLLRTIGERQDADDTFVMFTSDNGPETLNRYPNAWRSWGSPGPLRGMKLQLYEGGCRVPGIIRWPKGGHSGHVSREPVSGVDVLPTLCEMAGAELPANRVIDGASILPALAGRPVERKIPLHWQYFNALGRPVASLRQGDWKVLGIDSHRPRRPSGAAFRPEFMERIKSVELDSFELYNLREDIAETRNLAASEPKRLQAMADWLVKIHREVKAEGVVWR